MNLLEGLNEQQAAAVTHDSGPALVIAGAGTGKTTVITRRIAWLIQQGLAKPDEILALTFTDKAASEMEERVDILLPMGYVNTNIMTFHALGDQILRDNGLEIGLRSDFRVMSHFSQVVFLREILRTSKLEYFAPLGSPFRFVEALLQHFSRLKDESISTSDYHDYVKKKTADKMFDAGERIRITELADLYEAYVTACRKEGQLDFGDQIVLSTELLQRRPAIADQYRKKYKYILVDEYQDTNTAQANMLKTLINTQHNLMAVGDDDQSIYRFRGAAISNIMQFQSDFPKSELIVLTHNYRSTQQILDVAYRLIQHNNPDRLEVKNEISKRLVGYSTGEAPDFLHFENIQKEHAWLAQSIQDVLKSGISPRDIAVLVRRNAQVKAIAQDLNREGIKTNASAPENLMQKPEVRGLLSFVTAMVDPDDSAALYRNLIGEYFRLDVHEVQPLMAQARRSHRNLQEVLEDSDNDLIADAQILLARFREYLGELTIGQLLYKFITETGRLDSLIRQAESSDEAALKVQNIAKLFRFIKDFESVSEDCSALAFSHYMNEIDESTSELNATDSPLDDESIRIMTVHRAKGLEFEVVFIVEMADQVFPSRRQSDTLPLPEDLVKIETSSDWHIQEERRLFYVALTRAKMILHISSSSDYGKSRPRKVSPFVAEALPEVSIKPTMSPGLGLEHIENFADQQKMPTNLAAQLFHDGWLHLSTQQVDDYLRDPGQFWIIHLLNMPKGPFHALVYGSAIHNAIELYNRTKLQQKSVSLNELIDVFNQTWRSEGFASKEHEESRKKRGMEVLKHFYDKHEQDKDWPTHVEEAFTLSLPDIKVRINGRFDAVYDREGKIEIRDYKTSELSGEAAAKRKLSGNTQLGIYALAWERLHEQPVSSVSLDFVDSNILASNSRINHEKTISKIREVAEGIRANKFVPKQSGIESIEAML